MINPKQLGLEVLNTSTNNDKEYQNVLILAKECDDNYKAIVDIITSLKSLADTYTKLSTVIVARKDFGCESLLKNHSLEEIMQEQKSLWKKFADLIMSLWRRFIDWLTSLINKYKYSDQKLSKLLETVNKSVKYDPVKQKFKLHRYPQSGAAILSETSIKVNSSGIPFIDAPDEHDADVCECFYGQHNAIEELELAWESENNELGLKQYITDLLSSKKAIETFLVYAKKEIDNVVKSFDKNKAEEFQIETFNTEVERLQWFISNLKDYYNNLNVSQMDIINKIKLKPIGK